MIQPMIRLAIWGVSARQKDVIQEMHRLGVLHIGQGKGSRGEDPAGLASLRLLRSKILGLVESLGWSDWAGITGDSVESVEKLMSGLSPEELTHEIEKSLEEFAVRLASLLKEKNGSEELLARLKKGKETLDLFASFFRHGRTRESTALWLVTEENANGAVAALKTAYSARGEGWEGRVHFVSGKDAFGVLGVRIPRGLEGETGKILTERKALPWDLSELCPGVSAECRLEAVEKRIEELSSRLAVIAADLKRTSSEWGPRLGALFMFLDGKTEQASVEAGLTLSPNSFGLFGWIPEDALEATVAALKEKFGDDVLLQWRRPEEGEWGRIPTSLKNPSLSAPFELFLKLLSPPSYTGVDPTGAIALFFPFFSGCMVGDIGYGAVLFLIALKLKRNAGEIVRKIGSILLAVSLWSMAWGAAWGEFFGDTGHRLFHMEPLWVERSESVTPVMAFTVALGAAHVMLGLLIGVWQGVRNRQRHQWMEKSGNFVILFSFIIGLMVLKAELHGAFFSIPIILLIVGLVLLIGGGGIGGIIEAFGSFGNIISYVRIAAIGLSSAILAMVASSFMDVFGLSVLGITLAVMIHLLNFVLAIGGSGLHAARLHYVEFFGKFYSGNGEEYKPFQRRSGSSWKKQ
ncbi:MAG: V-type ATP synthase subunit I [Aminivibrio sp.]|jgi:V/A-type H+-transporting ATPase subunit I